MKVAEFIQFLKDLGCGWASENGLRYGDAHADVKGVMVCWMCTTEAIRVAAERGFNVILCHEDMLFPPSYAGGGTDHLAGPINARRLALLGRLGINVIRAHGPLDKFCILDDFANRLGLKQPRVRDVDAYIRIFDVEPVPFAQMIARTKDLLHLGSVRYWAPPDHITRIIGLPWGGLGLSINAGFIQRLLEYKPDTLIAGECDEYAFYALQDAGVAIIETGHATSENPGLEHFAEHVKSCFPGLEVIFYRNCEPFRIG